MKKILSSLIGTTLLSASPAVADSLYYEELFEMSPAELAQIQVTSVSKRVENAFEAPAAVTVITAEEIQNTGYQNITELLRLVPGMQVAQIDSSRSAVSARGFARDFANKMLVLMDGRTIYNPLISGVFWDEHNIILDDIERIEVIRGPGATMWGANAVNGVINIITKQPQDVLGGYASVGMGNKNRIVTEARYGIDLDDDDYLSVYGKFYQKDTSIDLNGDEKYDESQNAMLGFKYEGVIMTDLEWSTQAHYQKGKQQQDYDNTPSGMAPFTTEINNENDLESFHSLSKFKYFIGNESIADLQVYYDFNKRDMRPALIGYDIHTVDFDLQHNYNAIDDHEIIWGVGFRHIYTDLRDSNLIRYKNDTDSRKLFNAFVQDRIELLDNELYLTLGAKVERNDMDGVEFQPSARLSWLVDDKQTLWAAYSRANRTPTINEEIVTQVFSAVGPGLYVGLHGNDSYHSEDMTAYEIGYRINPNNDLSVDLSGFYNHYKGLRTLESGANDPFYPDVIASFYTDNDAQADIYGFEIATKYSPYDNWRLGLNYSFIKIDIDVFTNSLASVVQVEEKGTPQNMLSLTSNLNLGYGLKLNNYFYYVDELELYNVDKYFRFDTTLRWLPNENFSIDITGQNLFDPEHQEFNGGTYHNPAEVERSVFGKITYRF